MKLAIHQPQYLPWLGYLDKIYSSDEFVFLDDVQYKKREFQNRNRVRAPKGSLWLTVPVKVKGKYFQKINEVEIDNSINWKHDHLKAIQYNYSGSKNFNKYYPLFEEFYSKERVYLCGLNIDIIKLLMSLFHIDRSFVLSSTLAVKTEKTRRIVDICKKRSADVYLSGQGAKAYMEEDMFENEGIKLEYQLFKHPEYKQNYPGFLSHLSAVDYLFNIDSNFFSY